MKPCIVCKEHKDDSEFNWRIKGIVKQNTCRKCQSVIRKRHYDKNTKQVKKEVADRKAKIRERYQAWKVQQSCLFCSESDPNCLDLHHLDPSKKDFELSKSYWGGYSWERIEAEINKCIVVCKNCHAKVHAYGLDDLTPKWQSGHGLVAGP